MACANQNHEQRHQKETVVSVYGSLSVTVDSESCRPDLCLQDECRANTEDVSATTHAASGTWRRTLSLSRDITVSWLNVLLLKGRVCSLKAEALDTRLLSCHTTVLQALHVFACM